VVVLARERGHGVTPPPRLTYAPVIPMMPVYLEYTPGSGRREGLYNVAGPGGSPCPGQAFLLFPLQPGTLPFCSFCSKQSPFLFLLQAKSFLENKEGGRFQVYSQGKRKKRNLNRTAASSLQGSAQPRRGCGVCAPPYY
jgi:hypothetical protein